MKKLGMLVSALMVQLGLLVQTVFAQATCTVNGQEVPCEQAGQAALGFLKYGIVGILVFLVLWIWAFVFWIMMIVHAATHEAENKAMWIILMVFTSIVGALIYYFVVKRPMGKQGPTPAVPKP